MTTLARLQNVRHRLDVAYHHGRGTQVGRQGSRGSQEAARHPHREQDPTRQQSAIFVAQDLYMTRTARATAGAAPRPAGRATPGPAFSVDDSPPVVDLPRRALGSAGGGDSTERWTMCIPRTIVRPSVRFSSCTTVCAEPAAPGAAGLLCFLVLRNSSVSARTRFMCCFPRLAAVLLRSISACTHLVKGQHLSNHLAAILERHSHPVVDLVGGLVNCRRAEENGAG